MHAGTMAEQRLVPTGSPWLPAGLPGPCPGASSLCREKAWRQPSFEDEDGRSILASRWTDARTTARVERGPVDAGRYVVAVALRPVRIKLVQDRETVFDGTMPSGMVHVTEPAQAVIAEFSTACDFIHFHVAAKLVRDHQAAGRGLLRAMTVRDEPAAQLSRTLTEDLEGNDPLYAESVGRTIVMRILALRPPAQRVGALPKWRLRRVQQHLLANISEPISLAGLAVVAGLSRMHFAAQFRAATGCRPHEYVLQQRIEFAKHLLASTDAPLVDVALNAGFQTQSHFSTVFKRLVGDTPARWQRRQRTA